MTPSRPEGHVPDGGDVDPSGSTAGPDRVPSGTTRRAVLAAAAGAIGSIGVAACSAAGDGGAGEASAARSSAGATSAAGTGPTGSATATAGGTSSTSAAPAKGRDAVLAAAGPDISSGPRDVPAVALTFHGAGVPARTTAVLEIARAHDAHLTVFAVGQWLQANPGLGKAILAAGHDLGNHTWSHQPMRHLSASEADAEVGKGAAQVAAVRGTAGLLFRPSGTPTSTPVIRAAARTAGYLRCISYDVDPQDYLDPGAAAVESRTLAAVRAGSIVSLHLGHEGTVAALPGILAGLRSRGLRAVTVTELLA
ncbi:polysaccharide deacetylase family protein [Terrabacter carboxydivorans]|uniref:NodB homology domain-containing protein n=1 Tax=Terrabacter carboxydivorans TaxID=619730 RepID=A0ABP5ZA10_9MICO